MIFYPSFLTLEFKIDSEGGVTSETKILELLTLPKSFFPNYFSNLILLTSG
jgi:hypothetical protein